MSGLNGRALVLALVAATLAAAARGAHAEQAVGLEAQGVDPRAALHNPGGLDVRDALGRPVSKALIERQIKAARVEQAAQAAYSSKAPHARLAAAALETLAAAASAITSGLKRYFSHQTWGLHSGSRPEPRPSAILTSLLPLCTFAALTVFAGRRAARHRFPCRAVLRC